MRSGLSNQRRSGRRIAAAALLWLCVMAVAAIVLAHSQSGARSVLRARMRGRVAEGAAFASLYVRDIQQRERSQAAEWLAGRRPDDSDLRIAARAFDTPNAVLLGSRGQVLQMVPARRALLGSVLTARYAHLRAADAGHAAVSNVVISASGGMPVVGFAIPFATPYGRRVFSPAFAVPAMPLGRYMGNVLADPGSRVFLVDAHGEVIAAHPSSSYASPHGNRVFASTPVAGTPWRLVGSEPAAQLYASVRGSSETLTWVALAGFALAGLIIIAFGARLSESRDELHVQARELDRLARLDSLTGLSNRRDLGETLQAALAQADVDGTPLTVLMIDLDRFKQINDSLGHDAGDAVLVSVAQSMRRLMRDGDTVGRWGGEEFLAMLPGADGATAVPVAERLRAEIERHHMLVDGAPVTVTVGAAASTGGTVSELIGRADAALYEGKRAGRNTVRLAGTGRPPLESSPTPPPPGPVHA